MEQGEKFKILLYGVVKWCREREAERALQVQERQASRARTREDRAPPDDLDLEAAALLEAQHAAGCGFLMFFVCGNFRNPHLLNI